MTDDGTIDTGSADGGDLSSEGPDGLPDDSAVSTGQTGGSTAETGDSTNATGETGKTGDGTEESPDATGETGKTGDGTEEPPDATETPVAATQVVSESVSETNHWVGVGALAFGAAGLGIIVKSRALVLGVVVVVGYLAYAEAISTPEVSLAVAHRLDGPDPDPGDELEVTVVAENTGDQVLADCRILDDVPDALEVIDGPARTATALRPGARVTFSYTVLARRGEFTFDGLTVAARPVNGSTERVLELETTPTTFACTPPLDTTTTVPLRALTSPYTGRVATDTTGEGIEFASLREYRHGDSLSRLDWNRFARDGELATQEFREERMATVVVLLDLRDAAYLQAGEDGLHAVDRTIDAAGRLFHSLLETGDRVGIGALSQQDVWLSPGAGPTHRAKARDLLATHPVLSPTPSGERFLLGLDLKRIMSRLSDDAQIILLSPVPDEQSAYVARTLHVQGHPVTVVSPDPTQADTPGRQLAAVQRSNRLNDLRTSGIRVLDWDAEETLTEAIQRASRRWSG